VIDKQEKTEGVVYKFCANWIHKLESREHWEFYWFQQKIMQDLLDHKNDTVLEIGVGSGFTANYLRAKGVSITTFDIDPEKKPDIVGNVVNYGFSKPYDCLLAFEILEHIPYEEFENIIEDIPNFTKKYAFVSLPRNLISLTRGSIKLPFIPPLRWNIRIKRRKIVEPHHHWEMDFKTYSVEKVERTFENAGMSVVRKESCRHIVFYALKVSSD